MRIRQFACLLTFSGAALCAAVAAEVTHSTNNVPAATRPAGAPAFRPPPTLEASFTEAQNKAYHAALDGSREEMTGLRQKLQTGRRDLDKLTTAEKPDEAAIRAKATEIGQAEGDLAVLKARALAQLRPLFTAQQMDRLARNPQFNGYPTMPPRRLGTNEMNLHPKVQHPADPAAAPKPVPAPAK